MPHSVVSEIVLRLIGSVICYNTGAALVPFIAPKIGIEPIERQKMQPLWFWKGGLTYLRGKDRFFYAETVALIGGVFWVVVALLAAFVVWQA